MLICCIPYDRYSRGWLAAIQQLVVQKTDHRFRGRGRIFRVPGTRRTGQSDSLERRGPAQLRQCKSIVLILSYINWLRNVILSEHHLYVDIVMQSHMHLCFHVWIRWPSSSLAELCLLCHLCKHWTGWCHEPISRAKGEVKGSILWTCFQVKNMS